MQGHAATKNRSFLIPTVLFLLCFGVLLAGLTSTLNLKLSPRSALPSPDLALRQTGALPGSGLVHRSGHRKPGLVGPVRRQGPASGKLGPLWLGERRGLQRLFLFGHFSQYHVDELVSGRQTQPPGTDPQLSAQHRFARFHSAPAHDLFHSGASDPDGRFNLSRSHLHGGTATHYRRSGCGPRSLKIRLTEPGRWPNLPDNR